MPAADPLVGQVLARKFRILAPLGEGGMGRVYRAEQLPLGVEVVIKTLHPQLTSDRLIVARFFREAQAASKLRHPNCVSVLDFGDADGTLYIAMELLRGRSLARVLAEDGNFQPRRVVRVVTQVLDVLAAAHQMDIVHRDLKPDNVMIEDLASHRDFVKVLDFGIAKITTAGSEKLTRTGMMFGTPSYMAPEQTTGAEIDGRADLYAVAVLMFELLTGRVPFRADTLPSLIIEVATKPAPPVLTVLPETPPKLAALIDQMLSKNPAERIQTALDFKAALEALDLSPAAARPAEVVRELPVAQMMCPRCGHLLAATAKFCGECGAQLGRAGVGNKDKLADLRRILPTDIVDELAQLRGRNVGERREIVALVIDLTGAQGGDGDALAELHDQLAEIAVRHTGTFEKRAGAGIVVAFGLAVSHADDAERALEAALEMRELIATFGGKRGLALEATCVIHGGTVIVESAGAFSPLGDTLELPTRVGAAVAAGKIVVTERIHKLVRTSVELNQLPAVRVKGLATPVITFELASKRIATRAPLVALARPPFAGRDQARKALIEAIESAPRGQTLLVSGEPGIGKSRLLEELELALDGKPLLVIAAPARPGVDRRSPTIARIVEALGGSIDAMRALGLEIDDIRALSDYLPGAAPQAADEAARDAAAAAAVRAALALRARHSPICVLIDDVHLADRRTAAVLRRLVTEPIARVTLVAAARPGYPLPWDGVDGAVVRTATLGHLAEGAIEQIVAGALHPTPPPRALVDAVVSRAGGSPLMALEVMRSLIDSGVLASIGERWTVVGDLAQLPPPAGLRALYAARIDALPAYARDVLACAAVAGDGVAIDLLEHVVAQAQGTPIERELRMLVARGLLVESDLAGRYRFVEASAREAIYDRLGKDVRRELHRAVALALEAKAGAPEMIGEHFELGGDTGKALDHYARAVDAAIAAREPRRAVIILGRARGVCKAAPSAATNRRLAEDSLRLADLLLELGDLGDIRNVLADGLAAAHADDDRVLIARTRRARGRAALAAGNADAALGDLEAALSAAVGLRDRMMIAELHGDLGEAHERKGELAKATDYLLRAIELVQTAPGDAQRAVLRLLTALGRIVLRNKEIDRAERFLGQALELAELLDDTAGAAKVLGNLAGVWHARGSYAKAVELATKALELSRQLGDLVGTARQLTNLGTLSQLAGDTTAARRHYDAAFAQAQRAGWREGMANAAAARDRLSSAGTPAR